MDQRFPDEFVTWHHKTPIGVKVDEVFGMDNKSGKVWTELARQIFSEQSDHYYRIIEHWNNGVPYMEGYPGRISVTHTDHFFAVALLPKTPEENLEIFNSRTAMGIDAESLSRSQVLKVRSKFLSHSEMEMVNEKDITENIIAWTCKEALYKAAITPGLDFVNSIILEKLPAIANDNTPKEEIILGKAKVIFPEGSLIPAVDFKLYSYESYGCCITIAISMKCVVFGA